MDNYSSSLHKFKKELIHLITQIELTNLKADIHHEHIIPLATYAPWSTDNGFLKVYEEIKDYTLVDKYRCYEVWSLTQQVLELEGDVIEVGVWRGGTGALIASCFPNMKSTVYLVDTFEGVVKASAEDSIYRGGEHSDTTVENVEALLKKLGAPNTKVIKGIFPDDFSESFDQKKFKLCHIDVDTYQSGKDIFNFIWPRMVTRGVVIFDDYGFWGCEGITKLFNEIEVSNGFKFINLNGHGIILKV